MILGTVIGYVDSRPTWDDTAVTVGMILVASAVMAAVQPRRAWWCGLLVGIAVVACNVVATGGWASSVALPIGVVGAGLGRMIGMAMDGGTA